MRIIQSILVVTAVTLPLGATFSTSIHHHASQYHTRRTPILKSTSDASQQEDLKGSEDTANGVYRRFAEHAWERLESLDYLTESTADASLLQNQSPIGKDGSSVYVTVKALKSSSDTAPIRYARYALLETLPAKENSIQVLNMVIFPNSPLPVWGADFVSLPGNKHLLLLDAQPMQSGDRHSDHWSEWYNAHVATHDTFPWGGDLPEKVQPFVSKHALWSRLGGDDESPEAVHNKLQSQLFDAYAEHFKRYLDLLSDKDESIGEYEQEDYITYRLENDPARPMLKRLFGEKWTETVLETVLFPK